MDHEGNDEVNEIFLQLFCFACLLEIDNALIGLCLNSRDGIASALEACEANANATAIASRDVELQRARKQLAVQAALSRHKKDPKQKEKQRIFKCWMEWQKTPAITQEKLTSPVR
ncbi:hypothetical protein L1889_03725 [Paenalcaligenes niemegkensis]|uniref:hypothetical protein n=1 Tax=Paenalcaligenes niemegkensis TaxID=2895469 RepID=UPI001EE7E99E|nr:hypothetical protein [Paenalcaligenes niemegkensis]MCQ9615919.1 hypothetical protein [Paenalcaligenes niemegkensis]